jgi:CspA family cold shock protein
MTSRGTVREWHAEEGWGVIDSADTPGGCWAHFSAVLDSGFRALDTGAAVTFTFEAAKQDGYSFRGVRVWPADQAPVRSDNQISGSSPAYHSTLTITLGTEGQQR